MIGDAGAEPDGPADVGVREPNPSALVDPLEDLLVALAERCAVRADPAEADGAQLHGSEQLERGL